TRQTDLQIAAGQGTYDPSTRAFTAKAEAEGSGLAISGSAAGAMHGRFINLISSDSGAGVRHQGLIVAARDIQISADGDIALKDTGAGGQVQIASTATVTNTGTLDATTGLTIKARDVVNEQRASMGSGADLSIDAANSLTNAKDATLLAERAMQLKAGSRLNNAGGIQAGQTLAINTQSLSNNAGLVRGKTLTVTAKQV
ncbi:hypothetical protein, partial [Pseudomonas turukhanskensis]|uniref:hypothetical protein n=1 Tax=Pseudomonas turukhanskensis TaxID=1806536 RepID=UPI0022F2EC6A